MVIKPKIQYTRSRRDYHQNVEPYPISILFIGKFESLDMIIPCITERSEIINILMKPVKLTFENVRYNHIDNGIPISRIFEAMKSTWINDILEMDFESLYKPLAIRDIRSKWKILINDSNSNVYMHNRIDIYEGLKLPGGTSIHPFTLKTQNMLLQKDEDVNGFNKFNVQPIHDERDDHMIL